MFLRIDKLPVQLPASKKIDPESASAVQELMGGRFGEMSTFNNYFVQSINLRGKPKLGAFYELVANICAEELGHIELVGLHDLGWHWPYDVVHHLEEDVEHAVGGIGGALAWLVNTAASALLGVIVGALVLAVVTLLPFGGSADDEAAHAAH